MPSARPLLLPTTPTPTGSQSPVGQRMRFGDPTRSGASELYHVRRNACLEYLNSLIEVEQGDRAEGGEEHQAAYRVCRAALDSAGKRRQAVVGGYRLTLHHKGIGVQPYAPKQRTLPPFLVRSWSPLGR